MPTTIGERSEGGQGMSLAALGAFVERAMQQAAVQDQDPASITPKVQASISGKIKKVEVTI